MVGLSHVVARIKHAHRLVKSILRERYKERTRSPKWKKARDAFLAKNSKCFAGGKTKHLQVHHIKPFARFPALQLEPSNFVTCCMAFGCECHLLLAHGDSFLFFNEFIETDGAIVLANPKLRAEYEAKAKKNRKRI